MRMIELVLINNVNTLLNIDNEKQEIYRFDKNKSNKEELKRIVVDINKSQNEIVYLITNESFLFEFFNRNITYKYIDIENNILSQAQEINLITNFFSRNNEEIRIVFKNNIEEILNKYGDIFNIDIEKLIKGTAYKVINKKDLINLINEDLNLISFKQIITSRLIIVFYRLTYFDLYASKASIGRFFANHFEKSESFKINLNRNPFGWFFTNLNNKVFRGYRIKPFELKLPDSEFDLKIRIAKKLLFNNVKLKIVAESLEISEEELKDVIYNQTKALSSPYYTYPYKL